HRITLDVNLEDKDQKNPNIFDGDTVTVFSIASERMNTVTVQGKIRMPGVYELKSGMRIADLINIAQGLLGEAYMEKADLLRMNPDIKTTKLININLTKALAGEETDNIPLEQWDKLIIYSKWDVKWLGERTVAAQGAVKNPGSYELSDNMTVSHLLMRAGGLLPEAHKKRALIMRLDSNGQMTKVIPLNLTDSDVNFELQDGDQLMVYKYDEIQWETKREVVIEGSIQKPGTYPRADMMKVSDLIKMAGGLLPEAYPDRALLLRLDEREQHTQGYFISPKLALQDDPKNNLELHDGDKLKIYNYFEARWQPERKVTIVGAVHRTGDVPIINEPKEIPDTRRYPEKELNEETETEDIIEDKKTSVIELPAQVGEGDIEESFLTPESQNEVVEETEQVQETIMGNVFERTDGMRVSDLINRAGGLLPNAYLERANLRRYQSDFETYKTIPVNLRKVLDGDKEADILLQDEDMLTVYTHREIQYKPDNIVIMYGAVQKPDIYTRTRDMRLSDLLFISGGLLPGAMPEVEITRIDEDGKIQIIASDLKALKNGDKSQDILLQDEDVISIRKDNEFVDMLHTVNIEGEVRYPGSYALKKNERLSDLIKRAGGLTNLAYPEASVITRKLEHISFVEQEKSASQIKRLMENISQDEYKREIAKAKLIEERRQKSQNQQEEIETVVPITEMSESQNITDNAATLAPNISNIPAQTETAISDIEEIVKPQYTIVTPARKIETILPSERVMVNLREALQKPGQKDDIMLKDGDSILIPTLVDTLAVNGAVMQPSTFVYSKELKIKDYINMAGGYSRDAETDSIYVIKANGMVIKGEKAKLARGDMIVVPTKVMVQKITDRWGQVISALKFAFTTIATIYTIKLILGEV
ncbi:hypothetical protein GF312_17370, partial [Candidatus Poribacteria bacterium]|nr:hypothetical protein [Candidatus Poribacteria bacterium]